MVEVLATATALVLLLAAVVAGARVLRAGGDLADRTIGFDVLLLVIVGLVVVDAARNQQVADLKLSLIVGLLGFLGTVTVAVYLRGGR